MSDARNAVVIGAGLGGLATALRLAYTGWDVTIVERHKQAGGKLNRWVAQGYSFDTGPSLITLPAVFAELFACADARLSEHIELLRLDPVARYIYPDGSSFVAGHSLPQWQRELAREFPKDISGFFRLLSLGGQLFELSRQTFFAQAPGEPPRREMMSALRHLPLRHGWGNYHGTVQHFIRDPRLVRYFDRYATYVGSSPYDAPATLLAIPYLEHAYGAYHIKGGLYQLVVALLQLLRAKGVELRFDTEVTGIETDATRIRSVLVEDSGSIDADVAVFNGDAAALPGLLGQPRRLRGTRSLSGFVMLLGVGRRLEELQHHTVYFSDDYSEEFTQLFGGGGRSAAFPEDPTVYVNIASISNRSLAPAHGETVFIMANCPASETWSDQDSEQARALVLRRLHASGFPDLTADIEVEQLWSPRELADTYAMPGGAIYGQASHGWRDTFLRPANRERRIKGLYRVGGSSHPGGGTPTVLMGARIVEELINRYESS